MAAASIVASVSVWPTTPTTAGSSRKAVATSIADFISSRHGKSPGLAALVTALALFSALPYIALQLKSVGMSYAELAASGTRDGDDGVVLAVASSSPRDRLDHTLARTGLVRAFAATVAGDEVARGKPAPDMFLAAAEALGVEPGACTAIEDSGPGVAAALAAGMHTIGIVRSGDGAEVAAADVVVGELSATWSGWRAQRRPGVGARRRYTK